MRVLAGGECGVGLGDGTSDWILFEDMMYTVGSLFAGIGGLDLAFMNAGFEIAWQVEIDDFCQQVLVKNFPTVPKYFDIHDCHDLPYVDVIVAGFPCQPFSTAGKQGGDQDDRYLIPEMMRVIYECQPILVFLENVPGFATLNVGHEFKQLLRAFAEMGYDAQWGHLRASDIGAPHKRERWFCVLHPESQRQQKGRTVRQCATQWDRCTGKPSDSSGKRCQRCRSSGVQVIPTRNKEKATQSDGEVISYATCRRATTKKQSRRAHGIVRSRKTLSHSTGTRLQNRFQIRRWQNAEETSTGVVSKFKRCRFVGNAQCTRLAWHRQRDSLWRNTRVRHKGGHGLNVCRNATAVGQRPAYGVSQPGLGGTPDGLPYRLDGHQFPSPQNVPQYEWEPGRTTQRKDLRRDRVKALGNAVVPQVVLPIAESMFEYMSGA